MNSSKPKFDETLHMYFKHVVYILYNLRAFYKERQIRKLSAANSLFERKDYISIDPVVLNKIGTYVHDSECVN